MGKDKETYIFGYSRKSPDDKKSTTASIINQNELTEITCKFNGWILKSNEEDLDISGGDRSRKGIKKQIESSIEFKKNNPEVNVYIAVKDSKRFARDSTFFRETIEYLQANGVKVFSIMKNDFLDPSNIGDRIISVVDEQAIYDAKNYARVSEKLKVAKRLPCVPAPFGYKYGKDKNWVINRHDANIVKGVVSDHLNKRNCRATIKDYKINKSKYYRIIKNAKMGLYSGKVVYAKKKKDSDGNVISVVNFSYDGSFEPIISEELWRKVNVKTD